MEPLNPPAKDRIDFRGRVEWSVSHLQEAQLPAHGIEGPHHAQRQRFFLVVSVPDREATHDWDLDQRPLGDDLLRARLSGGPLQPVSRHQREPTTRGTASGPI